VNAGTLVIRSGGHTSRARLRTGCLIALFGIVLGAGLYVSGPSSAHWYGFTGDNYWSCWTSHLPLNKCLSPEVHSYWFASAKKIDGGGSLRVCAIARNDDAERGMNCGTDFVRACYMLQPYPNCHDEDGFSARAAAGHDNVGQTRQVQGHGAY
jgi:hypothetical protein